MTNKENKTVFGIENTSSGPEHLICNGYAPNVEDDDPTPNSEIQVDGYVRYMWYINHETGKKEKMGFKPLNYDNVVNEVDKLMEDVKMLKAKLAEQQQEIERLKEWLKNE